MTLLSSRAAEQSWADMIQTTATPSTRHTGRGHLKALDGIRGMAILMVLFHHAFLSNFAAGGAGGQLLGKALHVGLYGVDLFFVLSGFLITGILLDTQADERFFTKFYSRRALRIFPLYYGTLFLLFALTPLLHLHWQGMSWLLLFDLQNLRPALAGNLMLSPSLGLFHFWSLAVEEQFYLLWPSVIFLLRDRRMLLRVTLALAGASLALRLILVATGTGTSALVHVDTIFRADSLLLGGVVAMLYRSDHWPRLLRLAPVAFFASFAVVALSVVFFGVEGGPFLGLHLRPYPAFFWFCGLRYTVLATGFAGLLVWSLRPASIVQSAFQHPVLRFFGKYSYGIYIFHVPAITLLLAPLRTLFRELTGSKGLAVAGSGFAAIAISIVVAVLSFHLFEKPFLRLKRHFDYESTKLPFRDLVAGAIHPAYSDRMAEVVEATPRHRVATR